MKKTALEIILFLLTNFSLYCQVSISELRTNYSQIKNKLVDYSGEIREDNLIVFPIIETGNKKTEERIKIEMLKYLRLDSMLSKYSAQIIIDSSVYYGLTRMNYQVSYNNNNILSMMIDYDHCGANCWNTKVFLNFNTSTGAPITIYDIINPIEQGDLEEQLSSDKKAELKVFIDSLSHSLESNKEVFKYIQGEIDNCAKSVQMDEFQITADEIIIYNKCYLASYLRSYEPEIFLRYKFKEESKFFKPGFILKIQRK